VRSLIFAVGCLSFEALVCQTDGACLCVFSRILLRYDLSETGGWMLEAMSVLTSLRGNADDGGENVGTGRPLRAQRARPSHSQQAEVLAAILSTR
jgi:hypothetical protein